ncbi:MAG TPA: SRPBCC domain-containing protein, partial [Candidatus Eisenbacteria bacterium]|nr:SRPBCC domain-containing protein [Candidatus Eisenbacteria bacterium]
MTPDGAVSLYHTFRAQPAQVWAHLTRPDLLARWLGSAELELLEGGEALIELWNGDVLRGNVAAAV